MKFKTPENEINNAIGILESLINSRPTDVFKAIRNYKMTGTCDSLITYRMNKQLNRMNSFNKQR